MLSLNPTPTIRVIDVQSAGAVIPLPLINCYSALAIPAYKRAVTFLAENLASFPRSVRLNNARQDVPHPLDRLLRRQPNSYQNPFDFWSTFYFHAAHAANAYALIDRDARTLQPVALHGLLPEDVTPFRYRPASGEGGAIEQWYWHRPYGKGDGEFYHSSDVLHVRTLSWDGMTGLDPVTLHKSTLERAATLDKYQAKYLRSGTVLRGALEVPAELDDDQMAAMKHRLRAFRGPDAEDDILIITSGGKLNNATTSPQQSQLVEQVAATVKQIAQLTGVPPEFLYELSEAKYNASVEQAGQSVVRYTFRTWIERAEDELTLKLLTTADQDGGYTVHINPDALLRGDTRTQTDTAVAMVNGRIATPNEGRSILGLPESNDPEARKLKAPGDTSPTSSAAAAEK